MANTNKSSGSPRNDHYSPEEAILNSMDPKYMKVNDYDDNKLGKAGLDRGYFEKPTRSYKYKRPYGKSNRLFLKLLKESAEMRAKELAAKEEESETLPENGVDEVKKADYLSFEKHDIDFSGVVVETIEGISPEDEDVEQNNQIS